MDHRDSAYPSGSQQACSAPDERKGATLALQREKADYAEAHLQISGFNDALTDLLVDCGRPKASLDRMHLPVGGRRFRPSVEDVVEFLIAERLVDAKPGAQALLERFRNSYHQIQVKAAVRSHSGLVVDALPVSR